MSTFTGTLQYRDLRDVNGNERWPGIVSRFQLVLLAGHRSKQLYKGAQPRIPVDPLKRRNTSIALEELRRGLVRFNDLNGNNSVPASSDTAAALELDPKLDVVKALS